MADGPPPRPSAGKEAVINLAPHPSRRPSVILGGLLVLVGAILLLSQFVQLDIGRYGWPFFVIVPGVVILFGALTARGAVSEGLAILGSIVTVTGLILLFQNATDHFESWAYAWALVFPGSTGLGMILYGLVAGRPGNVRAGIRVGGIGLLIFLLGAAFFEGVIGIGGYTFDRTAGVVLGVIVIGIGGLMLLLNLTSSRRDSR
jgi:hypothetical protein